MTALIQDRKPFELTSSDTVFPPQLGYPVAASTTLFGGGLVALNAAGYAVPNSSGTAALAAQRVVGTCFKQVVNLASAGTGLGGNGALNVIVQCGVLGFVNSAAGVDNISMANVGQLAYGVDDNVVALTDGGGTRPAVGVIVGIEPQFGQVMVNVGQPALNAINTTIPGTGSNAASVAYKARAVVTTLQAYTGTTTNQLTQSVLAAGLSAADGVTLAVGDVVIIQEGTANLTAAADAGPWQVVTLGSASILWVLQRPDWYATGSKMIPGTVIQVGGEGTLYTGSAWKSFAASSGIVGTTAPLLIPDYVGQQVTLVAGAVTISNVPIRSGSKTTVSTSRITPSGTASTVAYNPVTLTAGALTVASCVVNAQVAAGTINASDVSTLNVGIENW